MSAKLRVHEIYLSVQGESTFTGLPCIFVRLTGCDLRCSYCDTAYAFRGGESMEIGTVLETIHTLAKPFESQSVAGQTLPLVEITGGEPLLQKGCLELITACCDAGLTVMIETSGAHPIETLDPRTHRIMDLKCPSSGESDRMLWENIEHLTERDEVKFVLATQADYDWAKEQITRWKIHERCEVLLSWCAPLTGTQQDSSLKPAPKESDRISRETVIEQMMRDALPARFQAQLHKIVWPPDAKGV